MDCSPLGSSVHGISQARILGWVAMPPPGDLPDSDLLCLLHWQVGSLPIVPPGDTTGAKYWGCMPATLPVTDSKLLLGKAPGHRVCMSTAAPRCPVQIHFSICVWGNRSSRMLLGFSSLRATRRRRSVGQTPHPQAPWWWSLILDFFCWYQLSITLIPYSSALPVRMLCWIKHLHSSLCVSLTVIVLATPWFLAVKFFPQLLLV